MVVGVGCGVAGGRRWEVGLGRYGMGEGGRGGGVMRGFGGWYR